VLRGAGQVHMFALIAAMAAAGVAGFSRGFAAFGAAMIYVPFVTLAYNAKTAVVTLFLVDILPSLPLIWKAAPQCDRSTLSWMALGAIVCTPIGVALLRVVNSLHIQLVMESILLAAASSTLGKQGLRLSATPLNSLAAGAVSGLSGGLCGIFGPPAMIYLLGRSGKAGNSRADAIIYLAGESIILGMTYLYYDMYTPWYLQLSVMLMPVYGFGMWYGASRFSGMSEASYRRITLGLLWAVAALLVVRPLLALIV
jgi:uncharacterized protein